MGTDQPTLTNGKNGLPGVVTDAAPVGVLRIKNNVDAFLLIVFHHVGLDANPVSNG